MDTKPLVPLYHKLIEISSVLSCSWLFFYLLNTCFSCFWLELIKDEKMGSKFKARVTVRAVSVSRQTPPRARWGSTPIPFDITGRTGDDELSVIDAKREEE